LSGAGGFVLAALVLDDPAYLLCGTLFLVIPILCGVSFYLQEKKVLSFVEVQRSADRSFVHEGAGLTVNLALSAQLPDGMQAVIQEILPAHVVPDIPVQEIPVTGSGTTGVSYRIIPITHGTIRFPGIRFLLCNRFYRSELRLTATQFAGPEISVLPLPYFERKNRSGSGERERDRARVFKGLEIRAFRNYVEGDDLRFIDWKLSAKQGKFIVREYSGLEKQPGIIVIDLPDRMQGDDPDTFGRIIRHATGRISRDLETQGAVSIVLISGINIVATLIGETKRSRCIDFLCVHAHPAERLFSASMFHTRAENRSFKNSVEREQARRSPGSVQQYLDHVEGVLTKSIPLLRNPGFYRDCMRLLLTPPKSGELCIYSTFCGDTSHIRILLLLAGRENIPVKLYTPHPVRDSRLQISGTGGRSAPVEVIP
jgi:uncharacterized protein (DUF58 family)